MSSFQSQRRRLLLASVAGAVSAPALAASSNDDKRTEPAENLWSQLEGTWAGELSYLDGALEPIIQSYHSVSEFALRAGELSHAEYKFYPAGTELTRAIGGDDLPLDEGIESVAHTVGPVKQGSWITGPDSVYRQLDEKTIVRYLHDEDTGVPRYVTYWTLTSPRALMVTNLGILSTRDAADYYDRPLEPRQPNTRLGDLKGCAVFRYSRLPDGGREPERQRLRELHNVTRST